MCAGSWGRQPYAERERTARRMGHRALHRCAGSYRRQPYAERQRTARSMSRRAPHALAQGLGGRRPYAERQRTATRMCRRATHPCAGSCRSLVICRATADSHEAWAVVPRTHMRRVVSSPAMKVGRERRTARSVGRRVPYALAQGRGDRGPYVERQRTVRSIGRHAPHAHGAGSSCRRP